MRGASVTSGERSRLLSSRNRDDEAAVSRCIGHLCEVPALRFASAGTTAVIAFSPVIPGERVFSFRHSKRAFFLLRHSGRASEVSETRNPEITLIHAAVACIFSGSRIARYAVFWDDKDKSAARAAGMTKTKVQCGLQDDCVGMLRVLLPGMIKGVDMQVIGLRRAGREAAQDGPRWCEWRRSGPDSDRATRSASSRWSVAPRALSV